MIIKNLTDTKGNPIEVRDKDGNFFIQKPDEVFVHYYDPKYAKKPIEESRANDQKLISNYGNIISYERAEPRWLCASVTNKNRKTYLKTGKNDYVHRIEWFSFALDELIDNREHIVLGKCNRPINSIAELNKCFDAKTTVIDKNGKETTKSLYEIHHENKDGLDNKLDNLECLERPTHYALDHLHIETFQKPKDESDTNFNQRIDQYAADTFEKDIALLKKTNEVIPIAYVNDHDRRQVIPLTAEDQPFLDQISKLLSESKYRIILADEFCLVRTPQDSKKS